MNCLATFLMRAMTMGDNHSEMDCFYLLVYITEELGWQDVYKDGFPKLLEIFDKLLKIFKRKHSALWTHIVDVFEDMPSESSVCQLLFTESVMSIFMARLNAKPELHEQALKMFDCFLIEGDRFIINTIIKRLKNKSETIMSLCDEDDLLKYLKVTVHLEACGF